MFSKDLETGYPSVIKFLTNAILKKRLSHSYVFISRYQRDSVLIANNLSKILNCKKNKNSFSIPCEECIDCKWINNNSHPQALSIITPDGKNKKEQIKVDSIRELLKDLRISSQYFRILLFPDSTLQTLTPECSNLLLKIVEEPPERNLFIFITPTKNNIISTVLSRSQILYLLKKSDSFSDCVLKDSISLNNIKHLNFLPGKNVEIFEHSKNILQYLKSEDISLQNLFISYLLNQYQRKKQNEHKDFIGLYKTFSMALNKHKSFMQDKFVVEDLLLDIFRRQFFLPPALS